MNIFKGRILHWLIIGGISGLSMVLCYKMLKNPNTTCLEEIYASIYADFLLVGMILPNYIVLTLSMTSQHLSQMVVLSYKKRGLWLKTLGNKILKINFIHTVMLLLPSFVIFQACMNRLQITEYAYFIFLCLSYFFAFLLFSLLAVGIYLRWRHEVVPLLVILVMALLPMLLKWLYRSLSLPTLSGIINMSYAFKEHPYRWPNSEAVGFLLLLLVLLLLDIGVWAMLHRRMKRMDFL